MYILFPFKITFIIENNASFTAYLFGFITATNAFCDTINCSTELSKIEL